MSRYRKTVKTVSADSEKLDHGSNVDNNDQKPVVKEQIERLTLRKTKKSGNYTIMRCLKKPSRDTEGVYEKIKYTIYGCLLPFGVEEYNESLIINVHIDDSTNMNYNLLVTLNRVDKTFVSLAENDTLSEKYGIKNKKFFHFMKQESQKAPAIDSVDKKEITNYCIRLYLRYGVKALHSKHVGELSYDQLKGKRCNLGIELGSLWTNDTTKMYGINIYVTNITVLN